MKRLNTYEFVKRASVIHNNRYNYENTNYVNGNTPVIIGCLVHGNFIQTPGNHIHRKSGCPSCSIDRKPQCHPKTTKTFIFDAKKIHGNRFDYSRTRYVTAKSKIEILCRTHGLFFQTPNSHLNGKGCPHCFGNESKRLTTEEFINRSKRVHGNLYDYSRTEYTNRSSKVMIGCSVHGIFLQTPYAHLRTEGCPRCKKSKGELAIEAYLNSQGILFETPKTFPSCINPTSGWHLYYDFFVPSKNVLIEFDGYQHFKPYYKDKFNLDSLKNRRIRDKLKNRWAYDNKTRLIRIKYTEIRKIPQILSSQL